MSALTVQLNQLNVGDRSLGSQQISSGHKERAETNLSRIISDGSLLAQNRHLPFSLRLVEGRPTLWLGDQEIPLKKSSELKRIQRIIRFYQHTGQFPRSAMKAKDQALRILISKKTIKAVNMASLPGTNGQLLAGMRIADGSLRVIRNVMYSIPPFGPGNSLVNHLGYYAAMFWGFFSLRELDGGVIEHKRSELIGDGEGVRRAKARLLSGGICTTASLAYLMGRISDSVSAAQVSAGALGVADALFGVGSCLAMGSSMVGALRCSRFNDRLNEYLEHPKLTQVQRLKGALRFLKAEITVTPEEKIDLLREIEEKHPHLTLEQKEKLLVEKIADLTEVKVKYMKRRTSNKSLYMIASHADSLLAKLSNPKTRAEGVKEATILLHTIQKENKTKMALYILGFIAALISFVAMLIGTVMSAGVIPFVLYGVAGTIYLANTVYTTAGVILKKKPEFIEDQNSSVK